MILPSRGRAEVEVCLREWQDPLSHSGWTGGASSPRTGIQWLPASVRGLACDPDVSLTLCISSGARLHDFPAPLVKQGLVFFWICQRELLTLRRCWVLLFLLSRWRRT